MKSDPSELFKILGVESRIRIIELLKTQGPLGAKSLAEKLRITPAAISQHLRILRQAGLVSKERKGYWIPYSINEAAMENCRAVMNEVCKCGCHEPIFFKRQKLSGISIESLKQYKKEMEIELINVQKRIAQLSKIKR